VAISIAQNVVFGTVCLDWERDCPALDDLVVKKFQCTAWGQSNFFQDSFGLAL
jgi:hypothetical protein